MPMRVVPTIAEFRALRRALAEPVGLVPTMGYLHEGHLSLVRLARASCASVVASVFVNPTQFAPSEDLDAYPRDLERDLRLLEAEEVDLVLAPEDPASFYPPGYCTWVDVEGITDRLEGASRPTHFRGVATVVTKLFHVVAPQRAFFGQKDAQQAAVIRRLIADLDFDIEMVVGPTVREPDGLAMSSRNAYLSPDDRAAAPILHRALRLAERLVGDGERDAERVRDAMRTLIESEPRVKLEYVSVADAANLDELDEIDRPALASLAARVGATRLIDNVLLQPGQELS